MLSSAQQTLLTSLHIKKYRQKYRKFLVEGTKIVGELLQQQRFPVSALYGTERWFSENADSCAPFLNKFNAVSDEELKKISTLTNPNQVVAVVDYPDLDGLDTPSLLDKGLYLYLDGLQDPGNMGTILRIADWFGLPAVLCSPDCVDAFSPKVIQSGMGACLRVRVIEGVNLEDVSSASPSIPIIGATLDGVSAIGFIAPPTCILVIGNEGNGIRSENMALLSNRVTIPRNEAGAAESLNAGVATGILVALLAQGNIK